MNTVPVFMKVFEKKNRTFCHISLGILLLIFLIVPVWGNSETITDKKEGNSLLGGSFYIEDYYRRDHVKVPIHIISPC